MKNKRLNESLINQVVSILNQYSVGVDKDQYSYMYEEDYLCRPFINTQLMTNKLVYILDILGEPVRGR